MSVERNASPGKSAPAKMSQLALTGKEKMEWRKLVEINHDDKTIDVRALAINASGHIFAGIVFEVSVAAYSARQMMVIVGCREWLGCGTLASLAINPGGDVFAGNYRLRRWRLPFERQRRQLDTG